MKISGIQNPSVFNQMNVSNRNYDYTTNRSLSFTNDVASDGEEKKKSFSFKKATNIAGVLAWLGLVAYGAKTTKILNKNSAESAERSISSARKQIKGALENVGYVRSGVDENANMNFIQKSFYKIGNWVQNATNKQGKELFNNLIYAFGTLVVMPTIVLLSPQKKENSEKGDKLFTILRQPFSVAATLIMQFTFDKVLSKKIPDVIKSNRLEDQSLLESGKFLTEKDGKMVAKNGVNITELLEKIRYNTDDAEKVLQELTDIEPSKGGLKGVVTRDELKAMFDSENMKSYQSKDVKYVTNKLFDVIKRKFGIADGEIPTEMKTKLGFKKDKPIFDVLTGGNLDDAVKAKLGADGENVAKVMKKFINIFNRKELITQKTKVGVNVALAAPIACTFLNVIYGKAMKALKGDEQKQVKEAK